MKNQTWQLVPLTRKNTFGCKWIYKTKFSLDGCKEKHKTHLIANGFSQKKGIDYIEAFSPDAKMDTI